MRRYRWLAARASAQASASGAFAGYLLPTFIKGVPFDGLTIFRRKQLALLIKRRRRGVDKNTMLYEGKMNKHVADELLPPFAS